jgi:hypothetical protein
LRKGETTLDALQILACDLITHDMAFLSIMKLLASTALVDTNHGNTDGPRRLANTQTQVSIIGIDIATLLKSLDNLYDRLENIVVELTLFKLAEKL